MADHDEKIDLVEDVELTREPISIEEQPVTPIEKIADRDIKKIDLVEEEIFPEKMEPAKEIPVTDKKLEIIEDEVDQEAAPAEIALERPEEYFEPKRIEDYDTKEEEEEEEALTDYERFIDEEMEESLPGVIAKEIPEEPEMVRKIPKKPAVLRERDDRKRPVRPKEAREIEGPPAREEAREELVISPRAERVVPSKRAPGVVKDACDETCPLVKEQKERIIRKLKERQRVVDHYYLTKGFSYFEDVCTCSLACMVYSLGRDPFVRSIFASLTLFAIGLKLCSELDAWEMPSRVS
ncbi:hypothetical protein DMN91_003626 [Ooceraea biroi]|uniref:Titin-like n=1 Tax=Ooceraea biroi TaxID=2015173 RepID=A0A3L8DSZ7_OOCBI|nr:uncharacterized protein LOC105282373 [Ooceraea biroi]RLU23422.1 hypothetical protein DMN91_003626 [Ooceraea biroi]